MGPYCSNHQHHATATHRPYEPGGAVGTKPRKSDANRELPALTCAASTNHTPRSAVEEPGEKFANDADEGRPIAFQLPSYHTV